MGRDASARAGDRRGLGSGRLRGPAASSLVLGLALLGSALALPSRAWAQGEGTDRGPRPSSPGETRTDGAPPGEAPPPRDDALAALADPLPPGEVAALGSLARALGEGTLRERAAAATEIRRRFGGRAAGPLLELSRREKDPERRFRELALVVSLVQVPSSEHAHDCGWLGVRWTTGRTRDRAFGVHVVEPLRGEPASRGGLKAEDEIVSWDGSPLGRSDDFVDRVQTAAPGSVVVLGVERRTSANERVQVDLRVTMGRRAEAQNSVELEWYHRDIGARALRRWLEEWKKQRKPSGG